MATISQLPKFYQDNYEYVGQRQVCNSVTLGMQTPCILIGIDGTEELIDLNDDILNAEVIGDE